jgi:hypothetical protein
LARIEVMVLIDNIEVIILSAVLQTETFISSTEARPRFNRKLFLSPVGGLGLSQTPVLRTSFITAAVLLPPGAITMRDAN